MRTKTIRLFAAAAVASMALAGSAQARHGADDPANAKGPRDDGAVHMRHGADDPAGHDRGDDRRARVRARHHRHRHRHHAAGHAKHGADDRNGGVDLQPHS